MGDQPLHDQSPTTRFTDRAADYARYRPSYPDAAIDATIAGLGRGSRLTAADIGAGTGIASRQLAERGVRVLAIEPNRAMREAATHNERVTFFDGAAEATGLADESVDVVLCAQAFHWFRPAEALSEFARILRPGGRVALLWNDRDDHDEMTRAYGELVVQASGGHPAALDARYERPLAESRLFTGFEARVFTHEQRADLEGLLGRARSASYVPAEGPEWTLVERALCTVFERFKDADGGVTIRYRSHLYTATRA